MSQPTRETMSTVRSNIQCISEMNRQSEDRRGVVDRVADAIGEFSGSMTFVAVHAV